MFRQESLKTSFASTSLLLLLHHMEKEIPSTTIHLHFWNSSIPTRKLTWNLKITPSKRNIIFQILICGFQPLVFRSTLPETNIAPKNRPWKRDPFWKPPFSRVMLVSGRVHSNFFPTKKKAMTDALLRIGAANPKIFMETGDLGTQLLGCHWILDASKVSCWSQQETLG